MNALTEWLLAFVLAAIVVAAILTIAAIFTVDLRRGFLMMGYLTHSL